MCQAGAKEIFVYFMPKAEFFVYFMPKAEFFVYFMPKAEFCINFYFFQLGVPNMTSPVLGTTSVIQTGFYQFWGKCGLGNPNLVSYVAPISDVSNVYRYIKRYTLIMCWNVWALCLLPGRPA